MINTKASASSAERFTNPTCQQTGLGWALWAVAVALPWLLPTHAEPWTTFYSELLMAAVLIPIAFWAILAARGGWRADMLVVAVVVAALIPLLQALGGMLTFPGEAPLISLYLSGFALTLFVAQQAEKAAPSRLVESLFAGLAVAALLSAGMALYQWLQLDGLGMMVAPAVGRPTANIGQPNNLSTLLVWGLIAIWWGYSRQRLGGGVATLAAAFLLIGVALTQSRTGLVAVGLLALAAVFFRRSLRSPPNMLVLVILVVWFLLLVLGLEPISKLLMLSPPRTLDASGTRLMIWTMAIEAITQRPWLGYGWNQSVQAHVALSGQFPDLHETIQFAHNAVLDLILWNGLPLGLLLAGGLGLWCWHQMRGTLTQERLLLMLALGVFLLHAMLELPHALAFFLLPVAVMMGALNAGRPVRSLFTVPRLAVGLIVLIHAGLIVLMFDEYRRVETDLIAYRLRAARIGNLAEKPPLELLMLRPLQTALVNLRMEPKRGMTAADLTRLRQTVIRYPSWGGLLRYARACALNGQVEEARWALGVLCRLKSKDECQKAALNWEAFKAEGNPEMALVELPVEMKLEKKQ